MELAVNHQAHLGPPVEVLLRLGAIAAGAVRRRIVHSSLDDLCDVAGQLADEEPDPTGEPMVLDVEPGGSTAHGGGPARRAGVVGVLLSDGAVLYDPSSQAVAVLDLIAADIWRLLDGDQPVEALVADLAAAYGADVAVVRRDVDALLERLAREGLVEAWPSEQ